MAMSKYKALITDFDNSIVGHDARIPDEIIPRLRELRKSGILITIATGRSYFGRIQKVTKAFPDIFDSPVVVCGGAEVIDPKTDEVIWSEYIHRKDFEPVFSYFENQDIYFLTEYRDKIYASDGPKKLEGWGEVLDIYPLSDLREDFVAKILVSASLSGYSLEKILKLEEFIKSEHPGLHVIKIKSGKGYGLDITGKTSKHIGVLQFLKKMNLNPEEVVGMGDSYNDYPLLTAVGTKVAMGDAPDELKEIADFIAPPQAENGILAVIDKYFK